MAEVQYLNLAVEITERCGKLLQCGLTQTIVAQIEMSQVRVWRCQVMPQDLAVLLCKAASFEPVSMALKLI